MPEAQFIQSPCVGICKLDTTGTYCQGCFRTRHDIAMWARVDNAARKEILKRAAERQRALQGK